MLDSTPTNLAASAALPITVACNICGCGDFADFRGRAAVQCVDCGSMERSRILQFILEREQLLRPGIRVLHIGPEVAVGQHIRSIVGAGYDAVDLRPKKYPGLEVRRLDLTTDAATLPQGHYDLILHSHVLEHVMADYGAVLTHIHLALKPSGVHLFCVPIFGGRYACDFGKLSKDERSAKFGQFDHVHRFGRDDIHQTLGKTLKLHPYNLAANISAEGAAAINIPLGTTGVLDSNTYFLQRPGDLILDRKYTERRLKDRSRRQRLVNAMPKPSITAHHTAGSTILPDRFALLDLMPKGAKVAEVGVFRGDFSVEILARCKPTKLHLIDAWHLDRYQPDRLTTEQRFASQISEGRVEINLGLSTDVLPLFDDGYFDWVYLDTDHSFETTSAELEICRRKVKPGGRIAGHDFTVGNVSKPAVYGVMQAVMDFCLSNDWRIEYLSLDPRGYMSFCIAEIRPEGSR